MIQTEEYEATVKISFEKPCYTNGILDTFKINLSGSREDFEDHKENIEIKDLSVELKIKPQYTYKCSIVVRNIAGKTSEEKILEFIAPSGGEILVWVFKIIFYFESLKISSTIKIFIKHNNPKSLKSSSSNIHTGTESFR